MKDPKLKYGCQECRWTGYDAELLVAPHPFSEGCKVHGCPSCQDICGLVMICDEAGCKDPVSCGTPVDGDYRSTCYAHMPTPTSAKPLR